MLFINIDKMYFVPKYVQGYSTYATKNKSKMMKQK